MQKRIYYLDNLKAFAMIMVILSHCALENYSQFTYAWVNSFHVPVFFFISGMIFYLKENSLKEHNLELQYNLKRKLHCYIVPFYVFSTLTMIVIASLQIMSGSASAGKYIVDNLKRILELDGVGPSWFLLCLFLTELMFVFEKKKFSIKMIIIINFFLTGFALVINSDNYLMRSILRSFIALFCYTVGYLLCYIKKYKMPLLVISGCIYFIILLLNGTTAFYGIDTGNYPLLYLPEIIFGSVTFVLLFELLFDRYYPVITWFGQNTIIVLVTHKIILELLWAVDAHIFNLFSSKWLGIPYIIALITIIIEIPIIFLANRYLYYLFGKKKCSIIKQKADIVR